jgi:hypothetical protein
MRDRLRRRADVNWVEIDGDVVAVDPAADTIHVFSGAAAAVWQLLDGEPLTGFEELLAETFGIGVDEAAEGLAKSIALLDEAGVTERTDDEGSWPPS